MVKIKMNSDQEILREAEAVLWAHLGPAQATRFWIALSGGRAGDYLQVKETLFKGETVARKYIDRCCDQGNSRRTSIHIQKLSA